MPMSGKQMKWQEFQTRNGRRLLAGISLAGVALRLWVSWQPVSTLVMKNLADDGFYYFMLARNTVLAGAVSFDGINLTNGFHPLWWLALMPVFGWPAPLSDLQIHLALSLASLLELVSIWLIGQVAACLTRREDLGALAALLYAANPMVILQATNGLETALGMTLLMLFWWLLLHWWHAPQQRRLTVAVGIAGGLMLLGRSDSIFFLGLALLGSLWYWGRQSGWRPAVLAGGLAALVTAPWFIWGRFAVGAWLQESAVAVPYAIRARLALTQGEGMSVLLGEGLRQLTYPNFWLRGDPTGLPFIAGAGLWLVMLAGLLWRWRKAQARFEIAALLPLIVAGAVLILAHAGVRWYPRPWYFIPLAAAWAVGMPVALASFPLRRNHLFSFAVASLVYYGISGYVFWQVGFYPWQKEMRAAADWLSNHIPRDASVGSFNAGIYAYYSGRRVVNLDGVVNHAAYEAVQARSMIPYLQQSKIEYLIDYDLAIKGEYAPFMGEGYPDALEEIAIIGGQADEPLGLLRVYQIRDAP